MRPDAMQASIISCIMALMICHSNYVRYQILNSMLVISFRICKVQGPDRIGCTLFGRNRLAALPNHGFLCRPLCPAMEHEVRVF